MKMRLGIALSAAAVTFSLLPSAILGQEASYDLQRHELTCATDNSSACREAFTRITEDTDRKKWPNMREVVAGQNKDVLIYRDTQDFKEPKLLSDFVRQISTTEWLKLYCQYGFRTVRVSAGGAADKNFGTHCLPPTESEPTVSSQSPLEPTSPQVVGEVDTSSCPTAAYCRELFALVVKGRNMGTWPNWSVVAAGQNKDVLTFEDSVDLKTSELLSNFLQRISTAYWKGVYCTLGFRTIHVMTGEKSHDQEFPLDCTTILQSQKSTSTTQSPSPATAAVPSDTPTDQCSMAGTNSAECRQKIASIARAWSTSDTQVEAIADAVVFIDPRYDNAIARQHFHDVMGTKGDTSLCKFGFKRMRLASSAALKGIGEEEFALNCTADGLPVLSTSSVSQEPGFSGYSTAPLDLSSNTLPPGYHGNDPDALFTALSTSLKKGEFESTADYNQRLGQISANPIVGSLTYGSTYAFYVESGGYAQQSETRYDADKQLLTVSIQLGRVSKERKVKQECSDKYVRLGLCDDRTESYVAGYNFLSKTKWLNNGTHTGANAYGAVAEVTTEDRWQDTIEFPNIDEFSSKESIYGRDLSVELPIGPTEAQALKGNLRILAICKLLPPYVAFHAGSSDATLSEPVDLITFFQTLQTQLLELWVYDISTGRIIAKISARPQRLANAPPPNAYTTSDQPISSSRATPEDLDCNRHPVQSTCRRSITQMMETEMRKTDSPDVSMTVAEGNFVTFVITSPKLFSNKTARSKYAASVINQSGDDLGLCSFGFTRMVVNGSVPAKAGKSDEFDLRCPERPEHALPKKLFP